MSLVNDTLGKLKAGQFDVLESDYKKSGYHLEVKLNETQVQNFARMMYETEFYLDFVTAVHVAPCFQVVYQFAHFNEACRINAKAMANEAREIPTIADVFQGAEWHERETHDFYGVVFTGHPDLRTLLLSEEDADLKPLLKKEDKLVSVETITRKSEAEAEKKPVKKNIEE
ncbi:MAG: NADH-quinone oxidoreductase subunit C [Desulfobacteraceae bacterium]|jgi:NADH-quinone oxidoreductase subunit C